MLKMTPQFARELRRQARLERERMRGRLGKGRFDAILAELVGVIRLAHAAGATGSLFGLEGPLRHAIRSDLCLQGWRWRDAHDMACLLLAEAFLTVRAERPSWNEGQREWVTHGGTLIERERCVRCGKPLPEEALKFCGATCRSAHHGFLSNLREAQEDKAVRMAIRSPHI